MTSRERNLARLLSSAGIVVAGKLVGSISTFAERIAIGRLLRPEAYGEVSVAIAILSFGTTAVLIGLSQGVPRYVSRFDSGRDVRGVWVSALGLTGGLSLVLAAALLWNLDRLSRSLFDGPEAPALVVLFVLSIPFVAGLNIGVGVIRGFGNTRYKAYVQDLLYPLTRILLVVGLISLGYGVLAAGYAYLAAAALAFVVSTVLAHRLQSLLGPFRTHVGELLRFSLPVVISSFLASLLTWTDTLMLGYFHQSYVVGQYAAAYPIAGGMLIILSSFGYLYLPLASRLDADDQREEIDHIYKTITKWIYVVTFPAFFTFVLFPADVVHVFFGDGYADAAVALPILAVGFFANAVGGRNRETIAALGVTKFLLVTNGAAFALNVALNLLLIPRYDVAGAAVASATSYVLLNVLALAVLAFGFDISPFSRRSVRTFVLLPILLLPPGYLLAGSITLGSLLLVPLLVSVGLACIVIVSVTGCLQAEDRVVLEFVENAVGIRIPFVRRYLPPG